MAEDRIQAESPQVESVHLNNINSILQSTLPGYEKLICMDWRMEVHVVCILQNDRLLRKTAGANPAAVSLLANEASLVFKKIKNK